MGIRRESAFSFIQFIWLKNISGLYLISVCVSGKTGIVNFWLNAGKHREVISRNTKKPKTQFVLSRLLTNIMIYLFLIKNSLSSFIFLSHYKNVFLKFKCIL